MGEESVCAWNQIPAEVREEVADINVIVLVCVVFWDGQEQAKLHPGKGTLELSGDPVYSEGAVGKAGGGEASISSSAIKLLCRALFSSQK